MTLIDPEEQLHTVGVLPTDHSTSVTTGLVMEKLLKQFRSCVELKGAEMFISFINVLHGDDRYGILGDHLFGKSPFSYENTFESVSSGHYKFGSYRIYCNKHSGLIYSAMKFLFCSCCCYSFILIYLELLKDKVPQITMHISCCQLLYSNNTQSM